MKKTSFLLPVLLASGIILFNACTKTGPTGPSGSTGPAGPVLTGSITGYVLLNDQYGAPVTSSLNLARVLLYNSTNNQLLDSVNSDSTGKYTINGVQTGTYLMVSRDAGYGQGEHQSLEFTGGTLNADNKMSQIPNFTITSAADSIEKKTNSVVIYGSIASDTKERTLLIFIGTSPYTSAIPSTYIFTANQTVPPTFTTYLIKIPLVSIYGNGIASGNTVYFNIYAAANNYNNGTYTDYASGHLVYTAIAPTPYAPTIVMP